MTSLRGSIAGYSELMWIIDSVSHQQLCEDAAVRFPRCPHRYAPCIDRFVALKSRRRGEHIRRSHRATIARYGELRPRFFLSCQPHVSPLHLPSRKLFFEMEIQPNQSERQLDRLSLLVGILYRHSVHDMLMDESPIAPHQRIGSQLIISLLLLL